MKLIKWNELPSEMQNDFVLKYYDILAKRKSNLVLKRIFDIICSLILLIVLSPVFLILAIAIKIDSSGPVFYRQERVTQYGQKFYIHKFRTMVQNADKSGSLVTTKGDSRITKIGYLIRKFRLDEISQLIDVLCGNMTFVGTRPEVVKYVNQYKPIMMATLLLPAGITSFASIYYKDEAELLDGVEYADNIYIEKILPEKMYYNLKAIEQFSFWGDIRIMLMTVLAVLGKKYISDSEEQEKFVISLNGKEEIEI